MSKRNDPPYDAPPKPRALRVRESDDPWTVAATRAINHGCGPDDYDQLAGEFLSEHGQACVAAVTRAWRKWQADDGRTPIREMLGPLLGPADYASGDARRTDVA